jgi:hypothetical protein
MRMTAEWCIITIVAMICTTILIIVLFSPTILSQPQVFTKCEYDINQTRYLCRGWND